MSTKIYVKEGTGSKTCDVRAVSEQMRRVGRHIGSF